MFRFCIISLNKSIFRFNIPGSCTLYTSTKNNFMFVKNIHNAKSKLHQYLAPYLDMLIALFVYVFILTISWSFISVLQMLYHVSTLVTFDWKKTLNPWEQICVLVFLYLREKITKVTNINKERHEKQGAIHWKNKGRWNIS